jgi:hypothetical protein
MIIFLQTPHPDAMSASMNIVSTKEERKKKNGIVGAKGKKRSIYMP